MRQGDRAEFDGGDLVLNNRVLTPRYYWKAVCDPAAETSVIVVVENKPSEIREASEVKVADCDGQRPK